MRGTLTLKKGHGTALNVVMSIPSSIGRSKSKPREEPRLHNFCNKLRAARQRVRGSKMSKLFFVNIPYNCSDRELQEWVESRGFETNSIRIVRDLVAGVSPAFGYVELKDDSRIQEAISLLNGKRMRNQTIFVKEAQVQGAGASQRMERRSA
jgi:RNA recognition motif-containing protein